MVRKSKRKQAVIPFERTTDSVDIDLELCKEFLLSLELNTDVGNDVSDAYTLSSVLRSLKVCNSILEQTKVLQENKTYFKSILNKSQNNFSTSNEETKKVRNLSHNIIILL